MFSVMDFGSCKQKYWGNLMAGQMDCRSVTDMKGLVHCVCLVVFSDDQWRQFAKKLSLVEVISVPNDSLWNGGYAKSDSSRRFSMEGRIPVASGTALSLQRLDWGWMNRNCFHSSSKHQTLSLLYNVLKVYTAHPAFYSVVTGSSFPGGKTAWGWS
jgi:hypothetical protein